MRHVTNLNQLFSCSWHDAFIYRQSPYTHDRTHLWMSHLTYSNALCHENQSVISHTSMCHVIYINESSFTKIRIAYIWVRHVTNIHESSQLHQWGTSYVWLSRFTYIHESRHIYEWVTSHTWMRHVIWSRHTCECVMSHTLMSHVTNMKESFHMHQCVMAYV